MKGYFIRPSNITPSVYFNPKKNLLDIRGRSSPENPIDFYGFVNSSISNYAAAHKSNLTINMAFEYFNTSSSKCLFDILKTIKLIQKSGKEVTVNWYYEEFDEDMKEVGEDYSDVIDLPFLYFTL